MHEPLLERIRQLERSVRLWRLVSLALLILFASAAAVSGTFGVVLLLHDRDRMLLEEARVEAEQERAHAMRAQAEAEAARARALAAPVPPAAGGKAP